MSELIDRVLYYARELSSIPNAPYLYGPMLRRIKSLLEKWGIDPIDIAVDKNGGMYWEDEYALYVHFKRGKAAFPLLIDSHLDHPAFVFNSRKNGFGFGSLGFERIRKTLSENNLINLRIFNPMGDFVGLANLTKMDGFKAYIDASFKVADNSHGLWDVPDFELHNENLLMHSADNMIATDVMLALIEQIVEKPNDFANIDVTFSFTFLEEIFEASAAGIAMRNLLPIGPISQDWVVIVLESMEPVPLAIKPISSGSGSLKNFRLSDDDYAVDFRFKEQGLLSNVSGLYTKYKLPLPNSQDGIVIKINDRDCVYGYEYIDHSNLAENSLLTIADTLKIPYQHTLFGGACNGTAFSIFKTTSHIATLSIPNPLKHNIGINGEIVPESVKISDVEAAVDMMAKLLMTADRPINTNHERSLALTLKSTELNPSKDVARKLRAERGSIAWGAKWRLMRQGYFSTNSLEKTSNMFTAALSRMRETALSRLG